MNFFEVIKTGIQKQFDKRNEEREQMDRLRLEASQQRQLIFEEEFRKNSLEVARAQAKKDAAEMSGLRKLRAMNRSRMLNNNSQNPESIFSKFSAYTQKNIARRQENLKRTEEIREQAKKIKEQKTSNKIPMKPFQRTGFR